MPYTLLDKFLCIENRRQSPECSLSIIGHLFERAILVSKPVKAICIGLKKTLGAE
jgi:hypothetical protein